VPKKLLEQVMDKIMVADEDAIREKICGVKGR